jgi:hypothetical protein
VIGATTLSDLQNTSGNRWTADTKGYNVAIVISPREVTKWQDIAMYGGQGKNFSSESLSFNLGSGFANLSSNETLVKAIFNGSGVDDPNEKGIICVSDSGITYPPALEKK